MTVDGSAVNEWVEPIMRPMAILEVEFDRLGGSAHFFSLEFLLEFWQFTVAPDSQELYSILVEGA